MKRVKICSRCIAIILMLVMLLSLSGCNEAKMLQKQVFAMNSVITLTAYGQSGEAGLAAAESVILSLNSMLDPELPTSTAYALNHAEGANVTVSGQIAQIISAAQTVYEKSGGALDLTIYPLLKRWGFSDQRYYYPSEEEVLQELSKLCFDKLVLTSFPSSGSHSVSMPAYGELCFDAAARGCAAQNAADAMRQAGVTSGIISMGGTVQTIGLKPDGTKWTVAVEDPNNSATYLGVLSLGEKAVVTSAANSRSFVAQNGKTYHHLLKPDTGYPANNTLASVTIIADDGTMADCLSTAMFILGESKALSYWRANGGFEMVLITKDNRVICTKGLIENFTLSNGNYSVDYVE